MIVLPGDQVPPEKIPASKTKEKPVTLGPGLCHVPPSSIVASVAGELRIDSKKRALWVENIGGRVSWLHLPDLT